MTKTTNDLQKWFDSMNDSVHVQGIDGGLLIRWSRKGVGFGELTLVADGNGKVKVDAETMGDRFVMGVLAQVVSEASYRG